MSRREPRGHSRGWLCSDIPAQSFSCRRLRPDPRTRGRHAVRRGTWSSARPKRRKRSIDGILAAHPDVVVLDVQLEGGTGLQVLRAVRQAAPDIAFVVFSNNSGPAYRKRYLGEGASRFLDKTTEFDQLVPAVDRRSRRRTDRCNPWRKPCPPPRCPTAPLRIASFRRRPRPAPPVAALKTLCSTCHLRDLCLPCGMAGTDVERLDSMLFARRKRQGRADAVPRRRPLPVHLCGAHRHPQIQPDAGRRPRAGQRLSHCRRTRGPGRRGPGTARQRHHGAGRHRNLRHPVCAPDGPGSHGPAACSTSSAA